LLAVQLIEVVIGVDLISCHLSEELETLNFIHCLVKFLDATCQVQHNYQRRIRLDRRPLPQLCTLRLEGVGEFFESRGQALTLSSSARTDHFRRMSSRLYPFSHRR